MSDTELTAIENLEDYLKETPLVLNSGVITDNDALQKIEDALREAHKEYGFDKLIVDAHDEQHNPITFVMDLVPTNAVRVTERSKKSVAERKAVRHYEVVPMKFGFKCNLDLLGDILANVEVKGELDEEKINYLKNSNTLYTKNAYIGTAMFAEFMKRCQESGAYTRKS